MIDPDGLLMIEPRQPAESTAVVDMLTRRMAAAWRTRFTESVRYRGFHVCVCGVSSDNCCHSVRLDGGVYIRTNSLAVHYLAFHRLEIPDAEVQKVLTLPAEEAEPTEAELRLPNPKLRAPTVAERVPSFGRWVPVRLALPMFGERVLICTPKSVEIARRERVEFLVPQFQTPAYVWESERGREHFTAQVVTHWMALPPRA